MSDLETPERLNRVNERLGKVHKCNKCDYLSKSLHFIRNHVRGHYKQLQRFRCEEADVETHFCNDCDFKTDYLTVLSHHLKTCHNSSNVSTTPEHFVQSYICNHCRFITYSLLVWLKHKKSGCVKKSIGKCRRFHCILCPLKTKYKHALIRHNLRKHSKENRPVTPPKDPQWFRCLLCAFQSRSESALKSHVTNKHIKTAVKVKKEKEDEIIVIDERKLPATTQKKLSTNIDSGFTTRKGRYYCLYCPYSTPNLSRISFHITKKHIDREWFDCGYCPFKTKKVGNLRQHIAHRHCIGFQCDHCFYRTLSNHKLAKHIEVKHPNKKNQTNAEAKVGKRATKLSKASNAKLVKCTSCDYKSKSTGNLWRHVIRMHQNEKEVNWFYCEQCDYKCRLGYALKQHISNKHTVKVTIKNLTCQYCSFITNNEYSLTEHLLGEHTRSLDSEMTKRLRKLMLKMS